jgi:hypothetical protein
VRAALVLSLAACSGDDAASGSDSATASATATATLSGTDTATASASGASDSATTTASSGTESDSAGVTSATTTDGTGASASETAGSTTSDEIPYCGDDPPKGYMGAVNQDCENEPAIGMFDPVVEWQKTAWEVAPGYNQVMMAPIVADVNGDALPDILYVTYAGGGYLAAGVLRVISGDGQTEILSIADKGVLGSSGLAAADIDDDGMLEIAAVTGTSEVTVFEHDGTVKWTSPPLAGHVVYPAMAAPAIADLDGDGSPEVILGRAILNNDGSLRGAGMYGTGAPTYGSASFAADILNDDGIQEVVVGNALYDPEGNAYWYNQMPDGYPAVADFDLDGQAEIVVVSIGTVRLQDAAGIVLWDVTNPAGVGGPPTIADYDGDGLPEVGVAGSAGYVVFDTDGSILWQNPTQDASSAITGSSVYDFEGDGIADVVYADEINLYVYSGVDGAVKLKYEPHDSGTLIEYPIVVDVDGDDQVEIVVGHNNLIGSSFGLTVLGDMNGSWRPGRKMWNQHAYNITNINDDGTVWHDPDPHNWELYNNFRSGDLSAPDGLKAPDLVMLSPESCLNECSGADQVTIWVQLGNAGAVALTAGATIEIYGTSMGVESLVQEIPVDVVLEPGEYADAMSIDVNTAGLDELRVVAVPNEAECIVDPANEIVLEAPFCTIPG